MEMTCDTSEFERALSRATEQVKRMATNLSPKELTEREHKIHALAKKRGITRAAAASIVDAEEAAASRTAETPEEHAQAMLAEEYRKREEEPPQ
jgi:hypothetical protein